MWIFLTDAIFSIVAHETNPDVLLVRSRKKGDIERYFPEADVEIGLGYDYLCRSRIPRDEVAKVISNALLNITYGNFKNSVKDGSRRKSYIEVWEVMREYQERELDNLMWNQSNSNLENL